MNIDGEDYMLMMTYYTDEPT